MHYLPPPKNNPKKQTKNPKPNKPTKKSKQQKQNQKTLRGDLVTALRYRKNFKH